MIELYDMAKKLFPGLTLSYQSNYAKVEINGYCLIEIKNGDVESSVTCYLSGMIAGYINKK